MSYMAANRDAEVFPDPHAFDIDRGPRSPHLAFGSGEHACPGNSLARLEVKVLLEELLQRFPTWDLAGAPDPTMSIMHNEYDRLPLVFHAR